MWPSLGGSNVADGAPGEQAGAPAAALERSSLVSISSSDELAKARALLGLRLLLRAKLDTGGSVLPPTARLLPLHTLRIPQPRVPPRAGLWLGWSPSRAGLVPND